MSSSASPNRAAVANLRLAVTPGSTIDGLERLRWFGLPTPASHRKVTNGWL